jgi:hypothetical protein
MLLFHGEEFLDFTLKLYSGSARFESQREIVCFTEVIRGFPLSLQENLEILS